MLEWTHRDECWQSGSFRIELAGPHRWLLLDAEKHVQPAVIRSLEPLVVARSLTEAKREAELITAVRRRTAVRKRHLVTLLLASALVLLLVGSSPASNVLLIAIAIGVGIRSTMILFGTLMPEALGRQHELFYQ